MSKNYISNHCKLEEICSRIEEEEPTNENQLLKNGCILFKKNADGKENEMALTICTRIQKCGILCYILSTDTNSLYLAHKLHVV